MHNGFSTDALIEAMAERTASTTRSHDSLLTPHEVASKLGVTVSLLGRWRAHGKGPPWVALGTRRVAYSEGGREVQAPAKASIAPRVAVPGVRRDTAGQDSSSG